MCRNALGDKCMHTDGKHCAARSSLCSVSRLCLKMGTFFIPFKNFCVL